MRKIGLFVSLLFTMFFPLFSQAATEGPVIGVVRYGSTKFNLFDPVSQEKLATQTFTDSFIVANHYIYDYSFFDISSAAGVEWVAYNELNHDSGEVNIYNQLGEKIDSFVAFSKSVSDVKTAVGNANEIIVCNEIKTLLINPHLKMFSYSESLGATEIFSIKPFGDNGGCGNLGIGDVDGDGDSEIIATENRTGINDHTVKIFNTTGELKTSFNLSKDNVHPKIKKKMFINDINNDEKAEIIFQDYNDKVYVYSSEGVQLFKFSTHDYNDKHLMKIQVGDIDQDGSGEIILQERGRKVPIIILNHEGAVENSYKLYPDNTKKRKYHIYLSDFALGL